MEEAYDINQNGGLVLTFEQQVEQLATERKMSLKRPGDIRIPIFNQFLTPEGKFDGVQEYFWYDSKAIEAKLPSGESSMEALSLQETTKPPELGLGIKTSFNYGYRILRWYIDGTELTYQNYLLARGQTDLNTDVVSIIGQY